MSDYSPDHRSPEQRKFAELYLYYSAFSSVCNPDGNWNWFVNPNLLCSAASSVSANSCRHYHRAIGHTNVKKAILYRLHLKPFLRTNRISRNSWLNLPSSPLIIDPLCLLIYHKNSRAVGSPTAIPLTVMVGRLPIRSIISRYRP